MSVAAAQIIIIVVVGIVVFVIDITTINIAVCLFRSMGRITCHYITTLAESATDSGLRTVMRCQNGGGTTVTHDDGSSGQGF